MTFMKTATMSKWIKWNGGECPVAPHDMVDVRYRIDHVVKDIEARYISWDHYGESDDVIEYRVVESQ